MIIPYFSGLTWLNRARLISNGSVERTFANRYGINYAHDGGMAIAFDHHPARQVSGPVAWITRPGHFIYRPTTGHSWSNRFINFSGPRTQSFVREGLIDPDNPIIPVIQPELVRTAFDALFDALGSGRFDQARAVHLLEGLLLLLRNQLESPALPARRAEAITSLCQRMRRSPESGFDLGAEAAGMGVSMPTFRRAFIGIAGIPPHQYLLRTRMERAAELLTETRLAIGAIATAVGMGDQYQFSKCFRRHHQMTPSAWRIETQEHGL